MQTMYVLLILLIARLKKSKGTGEVILIFYLTKPIQCIIILICNDKLSKLFYIYFLYYVFKIQYILYTSSTSQPALAMLHMLSHG